MVASVVLSRGRRRRNGRIPALARSCRLAAAIGLSLALGLGGPAAAHQAEPAAGADEAEAQRLFEEGSKAYNLGNFDVAIEQFEAAYELSHADALLYNLGQAYSKRYEVEADPAHLRKARVLFLNFAKIREAAGSDARDARERIAAIDAQLAELGKGEAQPEGPAPAPESPAKPPYRPRAAGIAGYALIGAGLVLGTGLGALGLVSAGRIDDQRRDEWQYVPLSGAREQQYADNYQSARALAFAGIGVGGALLVTGVVLVAVDAARGKTAPRRAQLRPGGLAVAF
ncbi:hypothetical protein OV079_19350 [Nannocystis pusilla]|uniref:Tetratricopeptide repeat protein n=1 Tax=Nannocystis pusilla TaxID=889268 RepID=A0A9X3EP20_9BACT|nr:hypothetical protein [Nannocystis pusilla]MCY1007667.1 hypothetical protein [Nannocystis pusilla]